jgi:hypothetical protein
MSPRVCRTSVGHVTRGRWAEASISLKLETMRAACRGEHAMRCSSLNERACSGVAPGNIRFVKSWR